MSHTQSVMAMGEPPHNPRHSAFTKRQHDLWWQKYMEMFRMGREPWQCWKKLALHFPDKNDRECETHYRRMIATGSLSDDFCSFDLSTGFLTSSKSILTEKQKGRTDSLAVFGRISPSLIATSTPDGHESPSETETESVALFDEDAMSQNTVMSGRIMRSDTTPPRKRIKDAHSNMVSRQTSSPNPRAHERDQPVRVHLTLDQDFDQSEDSICQSSASNQAPGREYGTIIDGWNGDSNEGTTQNIEYIGPIIGHSRKPVSPNHIPRNPRNTGIVPTLAGRRPKHISNTFRDQNHEVTERDIQSHRAKISSRSATTRIKSKTQQLRERERRKKDKDELDDFIVLTDDEIDDPFPKQSLAHELDQSHRSRSPLSAPFVPEDSSRLSPRQSEQSIRKAKALIANYFPRDFPLEVLSNKLPLGSSAPLSCIQPETIIEVEYANYESFHTSSLQDFFDKFIQLMSIDVPEDHEIQAICQSSIQIVRLLESLSTPVDRLQAYIELSRFITMLQNLPGYQSFFSVTTTTRRAIGIKFHALVRSCILDWLKFLQEKLQTDGQSIEELDAQLLSNLVTLDKFCEALLRELFDLYALDPRTLQTTTTSSMDKHSIALCRKVIFTLNLDSSKEGTEGISRFWKIFNTAVLKIDRVVGFPYSDMPSDWSSFSLSEYVLEFIWDVLGKFSVFFLYEDDGSPSHREVPANWLLVQELLQRSLLAAGYTHGLPFVEVTNSPHGILGPTPDRRKEAYARTLMTRVLCLSYVWSPKPDLFAANSILFDYIKRKNFEDACYGLPRYLSPYVGSKMVQIERDDSFLHLYLKAMHFHLIRAFKISLHFAKEQESEPEKRQRTKHELEITRFVSRFFLSLPCGLVINEAKKIDGADSTGVGKFTGRSLLGVCGILLELCVLLPVSHSKTCLRLMKGLLNFGASDYPSRKIILQGLVYLAHIYRFKDMDLEEIMQTIGQYLGLLMTEYDAIVSTQASGNLGKHGSLANEINRFGIRVHRAEDLLLDCLQSIEQLIQNSKGCDECGSYKILNQPFPQLLSNPNSTPQVRIAFLRIVACVAECRRRISSNVISSDQWSRTDSITDPSFVDDDMFFLEENVLQALDAAVDQHLFESQVLPPTCGSLSKAAGEILLPCYWVVVKLLGARGGTDPTLAVRITDEVLEYLIEVASRIVAFVLESGVQSWEYFKSSLGAGSHWTRSRSSQLRQIPLRIYAIMLSIDCNACRRFCEDNGLELLKVWFEGMLEWNFSAQFEFSVQLHEMLKVTNSSWADMVMVDRKDYDKKEFASKRATILQDFLKRLSHVWRDLSSLDSGSMTQAPIGDFFHNMVELLIKVDIEVSPAGPQVTGFRQYAYQCFSIVLRLFPGALLNSIRRDVHVKSYSAFVHHFPIERISTSEDPKFKASTMENLILGLSYADIVSDTDRMRQILRLVGMAFDEQERILVDRVDPSASAHLIPALISTLDIHSEMNKHTILTMQVTWRQFFLCGLVSHILQLAPQPHLYLLVALKFLGDLFRSVQDGRLVMEFMLLIFEPLCRGLLLCRPASPNNWVKAEIYLVFSSWLGSFLSEHQRVIIQTDPDFRQRIILILQAICCFMESDLDELQASGNSSSALQEVGVAKLREIKQIYMPPKISIPKIDLIASLPCLGSLRPAPRYGLKPVEVVAAIRKISDVVPKLIQADDPLFSSHARLWPPARS